MTDPFGRTIDYLRISVTDRCSLRCRYCMPKEGVPLTAHENILTYEELLLVAEAAVGLGIDRFKITGGEPLIRRDCPDFIRRLKALPGVRQVTLTTNGLLLPEHLEELLSAGLDGVNVSLDTLDEKQFQEITRSSFSPAQVLGAVKLCSGKLRTKINAVMLTETESQLLPLAALARKLPVDVRFIEQMPIGPGARTEAGRSPSPSSALMRLKEQWPLLSPLPEGDRRGNGPARYYTAPDFQGAVGFIEAVSRSFCSSCNRIRLTSTGTLKPCLCYEDGIRLAPVLRGHHRDRDELLCRLRSAIQAAVLSKPSAHCFDRAEAVSERKSMSQIGG